MSRDLTQQIKQRALELGFSKVGVARAEALGAEGERLKKWLASGFHASMSWMARNLEKRIDPRAILPDARSVLAVAMNYYTVTPHSVDEDVGKISRYAWGDDYHDILTKKLGELLAYVQEQEPGTAGKVYVDTGPMLDKVWAQRAGIGWEGKHTNVITREYGSWVFLGELVLNIPLEYDSPATDHCGSCTRCIEACPTDAIVEPYVVDSNRCISYLTIEHRGEIAEALGESFDRWIYGCDVCQDVCPWNTKFAQPAAEHRFAPRPHNIAPDLVQWAQMSEEYFQAHFSGSAMKRTKLGGLRRNASVASNAIKRNKEIHHV